MTTTEKKTITITMSETSPVKIDPEQWHVIASADHHDGKVVCQANNVWLIEVREHDDGRRLVYGMHEAGNGGQYEGFRPTYGGYLFDEDGHGSDDPKLRKEKETATIRAIRRVAGLIGDSKLGDECVANLPAQEI